MQQVLFEIPFPGIPDGIPIYGFGMMLFLAFVVCTWVASRRARQEGIAPERIQDMALWVFVFGIAGARTTYLLVERQVSLWGFLTEFPKIWDGGLVFYGSVLGGLVGYSLAYLFVLRKHGISNWKVADILAPAIAIGICLGRFGCFLNGCCYGHVNCEHGPALGFPLSSPPRFALVNDGLQTAAGFTMEYGNGNERRVAAVDPGSAAYAAGLRPGDLIVAAGDHEIETYRELSDYFVHWKRGQKELTLTVEREGKRLQIGPFTPLTLPLHPTQLYSSVGGLLLFLLVQAYYPLRRRDGEVMALLMLAYPFERFVEESLRSDNPPMTFGLTFSQNVSAGLLLGGVALAVWLLSKPAQYPRPAAA